MSHLPLDARAILHYLNELGYTNISAAQLKEFLKDLRKLIKYEERAGVNIHHDDYYEGLFRRTTASYRAKVDQEKAGHGNNGRNNTSRSIKGDVNSRKERHLDYKENVPAATVTSSTSAATANKSYKELLEENGRRSGYHKSENVKNVLENYYQDWQTRKTLKANNDQEINSNNNSNNNNNNNTNVKFTKQNTEKIDSSAVQVTREIIDEILDKIRTSSMEGILENGLPKATTPTYSRIREMVIEEVRQQLEKNLPTKLTFKTNEETCHNSSVTRRACFSDSSPTLTRNNNLTKIRRLPQEKVKKPYWEAVQTYREQGSVEYNNGNKNDKNKMPQCHQQQQRSKSPAAGSSNASSGRTTNRSRSVLVSRSSSASRRRKPHKNDPVALYQYYKNEWEHFSKQIPGQTNHQQLRWQIRQRLMDSD